MITVRFYKQDKDGPVVREVNQRISLRREPAKRYREIGHVKVDYTHQPPTNHPEDEDRDALCCALEYMRAFTADEFMGWVVQNLAAQGLNYIANTVASTLRHECKEASVIVFELGDI